MKYLAIYFLFLKRLIMLQSPISALSANSRLFLSGLLQIRKTEFLEPLQGTNCFSIAPYRLFARGKSVAEVQSAHADLGGVWPVVIKPNIGERGLGVRIVHNHDELRTAVDAQIDEFLLQTYVGGEEFGIFIIRSDLHAAPEIVIGKKIAPSVKGNGRDDLATLIAKQQNSHRRYLTRRNKDRLDIVPDMDQVIVLEEILHGFRGTIQEVIRDIPPGCKLLSQVSDYCNENAYRYGRIDCRAKDLQALFDGDGVVLEINGLASLPPQLTADGIGLTDQWRVLYQAWSKAYQIGDANIAAGSQPHSFLELVSASVKHLVYRIRFVINSRANS